MPEDSVGLGKRLQLARKRAGLTQQELCAKAGLSYSTLAKIERGAIKTPSVFTVASIAAATQSSVEDLLGIKTVASKMVSTKKISKQGVRFVYFDVNGVLTHYYHRAYSQIAKKAGTSPDHVETIFWRYNDIVCRGEMSMSAFNQAMARDLNLPKFDWEEYYLNSVDTTPEVHDLVEWAAENYEVGILSNNMPGLIKKLIKNNLIPDLKYKAIIDSCEVGSIKPESKIYKLAEERSEYGASEILLIDDTRPNLVTADKLGWQVLWFDDLSPIDSAQKARDTLAF